MMRRALPPPRRRLACAALAAIWPFVGSFFVAEAKAGPARSPLTDPCAQVQPRMVKLYGAGGLQGLEAYQTGALVSPEGHILTVWSHVLDSDTITAVLSDGRKFSARLLGADPWLEVAVLKIDASELLAFDLRQAVDVPAGDRVLAVSNLFGVATGNEWLSVQQGIVAARTQLAARRGVFETRYHGPAYVLDVITNNPGAAGGVVITPKGELVAMLGKELRNTLNNTWLNYAVPIEALRKSVEDIRAGKFVAREASEERKKPQRPLQLSNLGIALVPDVVERTPPYIDAIAAGSPAARAGLRPDDLVLLLGDRLIQSCKGFRAELEYIDFEDPIKLTVQRGQELLEFTLRGRP